VPNALISVSNKTGLEEFAHELIELGFQIFSTGGTAKALRNVLLPVTEVADYTGFPEMMGGRVKTLHPRVHGGLLGVRSNPDHMASMDEHGIVPFDMVVVNLYPFRETIAKAGVDREEAIEQIDIGGPAMLRSAAKNHESVTVVVDPGDYSEVLDSLKSDDPNSLEMRKQLAAKVFYHTAQYDQAITTYLSGGEHAGFSGVRVATCKYGENGSQTPAHLYSTGSDDPLALDNFDVIEGTSPSYNNICDMDRLLQTATHIAQVRAVNQNARANIAVGVKHGNACGAAVGFNRDQVTAQMMKGHPKSIFGGLVMMNFVIDEQEAECLAGRMLDGIIAPDITPEAIAMLRRKGDKCRFIVNHALTRLEDNLDRAARFRYVRGGFLQQPNYTFVPDFNGDEIMKHGPATPEWEADMMLAWAIGSTSNSNTITLVKDNQLIGNGVGQQDRVGAAELTVVRARQAGHEIRGAVAYSDSFFPFPDGPEVLIEAGVSAIFTTSGSVRDHETIDLCAKNGVALYMIPDAKGRGFFGH
jgi:phosphoribosylaminoimidazolecarboxamide formyltransferase/IMP cyclohydrolase